MTVEKCDIQMYEIWKRKEIPVGARKRKRVSDDRQSGQATAAGIGLSHLHICVYKTL